MREPRRRRWLLFAAVATVLALPLWVAAGPLVVPDMAREGDADTLNAMGAGRPAKAAEVNHNFAVLAERLNALETEVTANKAELAALKASPPLHGASSVRVFETSGTWTRPVGVNRVWIRVVGGGGGGGAGDARPGAGGGGGGYAEKWIDVRGVDSVTVTVGSGGIGGTTTGNLAPGLKGGTSSFGSFVSATGGGGGGDGGAERRGSGGEGQNGDLNVRGQSGQAGRIYDGIKRLGRPGFGGGSVLGNGGLNELESGASYGGGGGGHAGWVDGTAPSGAPGVVIVWEYE